MYKDNRGYLIFPIKNDKYMDKITQNTSKECTYSVNKKNVFRGLHINTFGKLITCILGNFIDIMVNMETFEVKYYNIKPGDQVYCPANYAHGFISLEENSILSYHCEGFFGNDEGGLLNYKDPVLNIKLPVEDKNIIINEKDKNAPYLNFEYFILGSKGYIGNHIYNELKIQGKKVLALKERMEDIKGIKRLIEFYKPNYFINAAGLTGTPNTTWCNFNKKETLMTNVINQTNILNLCNEYNIHCLLIGSGAIFKPCETPKYGHDKGDLYNDNEYYSKCRILLEEMIRPYSNYILLRINYPISYKKHDKNLLYKLLKYENIEDISLSVTNLDSLCPLIPKMLENKETGVFNFVNNGSLKLKYLIDKIEMKKGIKLNKKYTKSRRPNTKLIPDGNFLYKIEYINDTLDNLIDNMTI